MKNSIASFACITLVGLMLSPAVANAADKSKDCTAQCKRHGPQNNQHTVVCTTWIDEDQNTENQECGERIPTQDGCKDARVATQVGKSKVCQTGKGKGNCATVKMAMVNQGTGFCIIDCKTGKFVGDCPQTTANAVGGSTQNGGNHFNPLLEGQEGAFGADFNTLLNITE